MAGLNRSGRDVTASDVDAARAASLAATTPTHPAVYEMIGQHLAENGYA